MDSLRQGAERLNCLLTARQEAQFAQYLDLLLVWNQRLNLTAVREPDEIVTRHFLDSLTCVLATGDLTRQAVVDVGTGAGFPGLPLKIAFPEMRLTLVESVAKKVRFLEVVVAALDLHDVQIVNGRAEEVGRDPAHREAYDWAVARAVAPLPVLLEYLLPLCTVGGYALCQKGGRVAQELGASGQALAALGGAEPALLAVTLGPQWQEASLLVVPKERSTPETYPRRVGIPTKRPL